MIVVRYARVVLIIACTVSIFALTPVRGDNAGCGLYVSPTGNPTSDCTPDDPCDLTRAFTLAGSLTSPCLFLRSGAYPNPSALTLLSGMRIYGGFDARWEPGGPATVITGGSFAGEFMTVRAINLSAPTVLKDLTIIAPNALVSGRSSYAVYVSNSNRLILDNVIINAGNGANGQNGSLTDRKFDSDGVYQGRLADSRFGWFQGGDRRLETTQTLPISGDGEFNGGLPSRKCASM